MENSTRTVKGVFELPTMLGVLQRIEGVKQEEGQIGSRLKFRYKGIVVVNGCKRGVCVRYKALVLSNDGKDWRTPRQWERSLGAPDYGGCLTQAAVDALWELAERGYDVGLWYDCKIRTPGMMIGLKLVPMEQYVECSSCGTVVNGVRLPRPYCRTVEDCMRQMLEEYRHEVERMREPPPPPPESGLAERLLKEWPELEAFGADWLRAWAPHSKDRLVELARLLRKYPQLAEAVKRRPVLTNPYAMAIYIAKDGSEVCMSFGDGGAYCVADEGVRKLDLEQSEDVGTYRPRGLLAYAVRAKEYMRIL